jgi:TRAP-type C4-dicarboxylate transport system permease small subunit
MTSIPTPAGSYPEQSQATTALVLSILGLLCCGILGVAGLIMGNTERKAITEGRRDPVNQGTAQAAFVVGIVAVVLWSITILGWLVFFPIAMRAGNFGGF